MPGDATHGFDMVIEFAEQAIQRVVSGVLDASGLFTALGSVLDAIPGVNVSSDGFRSSINFDRPTGISFPAGAQPVDIRLDWLNSGGTVEAELRIVAGLVVDRSSPDTDLLMLDLKNSLFFLDLHVGSSTIAQILLNPVRNWLRDHLPAIPLVPVPVDRTTTDPIHTARADAILCDASTDARDAIGVALTFGGGTPGNTAAFTSGLVDWGTGEAPGAIAVFFGWVLRMLDPALDNVFDQPAGTFVNGQLTRSFGVGDDVTLESFSITLQDGFLAVSAQVSKSGFCWSATGTISAKVLIRIVDGRLQVSTEVGDPDVELDVPWYCYLIGAVVGLIGGFLIGGIIGAVVGAILVPLLIFALEEALEGTLDGIADRIRDALNRLAPSVDIPAVGINIVFQSVEIDDITVRCTTTVPDLAPVRSAGTTVLTTGRAIDLDTGRVGDATLEGADLRLDGTQDARALRTVCAASLARTGRHGFEGVPRWECYGLAFQQAATVFQPEMWTSIHVPIIGDFLIPTGRVFAVRTGQGRYAVVQVVAVEKNSLTLRWKTWDLRAVSARIDGSFECEDFAPDVVEPTRFELGRPFEIAEVASKTALVAYRDKTVVPSKKLAGRVGEWSRLYRARKQVGRFVARTEGFLDGTVHRWSVNGRALEGTGELKLEGVVFGYVQNGPQLVLTPKKAGVEVFLELKLEVTDKAGDSAVSSRCVKLPKACARTIRVIPSWGEYHVAYLGNVGVQEVHTDVVAVHALLDTRQVIG